MADQQNIQAESKEPKWVKTLVDYGPLVAFFVTYWKTDDLIDATKVIMATTAAAILISLIITRKLPIMPLVTAAVIGIFGGLTIYLNDETFIKMKPTIIQAAFGLILGFGLLIKKVWLKHLFGAAMKMEDAAWRILTKRFIGFFFFSAILNEIIWRTQSTDFWVNFKVFGLILLTFGFIATQMPFMSKNMIEDEDNKDA